jgi:hypothetical protein
MGRKSVHWCLIAASPGKAVSRQVRRLALLGAVLLAASLPADSRAGVNGSGDGSGGLAPPGRSGSGSSGRMNSGSGRRQHMYRSSRRLVKG